MTDEAGKLYVPFVSGRKLHQMGPSLRHQMGMSRAEPKRNSGLTMKRRSELQGYFLSCTPDTDGRIEEFEQVWAVYAWLKYILVLV